MMTAEEAFGVFNELKTGLNDFMLNVGSKNIPLAAKNVFTSMWEEIVLRLHPLAKRFRQLDPDFPFLWQKYEDEIVRQQDLMNLLKEAKKSQSSLTSSDSESVQEEIRYREKSIVNPSEKSLNTAV